ncbi:uncharacterized protein SPAPADRAFT_60940, partial [Spathaspora passalidarum NRRL Y-27907]
MSLQYSQHNHVDVNGTIFPIKNDENRSILSMPYDCIFEVLQYLNQIDLVNVCLVNRELCYLARRKLYRSIFVVILGPPIEIKMNVYNYFYTNYTIMNRADYRMDHLLKNPNLQFCQLIRFNFIKPVFCQRVQRLYPRI